MEDRIKAEANKRYYQKKKAEKLEVKKDDSKLIDVQNELRDEQCRKLGLPVFLASYLKVNKRFVSFVAPDADELLLLCKLIVDHCEEVKEAYQAMLNSDMNSKE